MSDNTNTNTDDETQTERELTDAELEPIGSGIRSYVADQFTRLDAADRERVREILGGVGPSLAEIDELWDILGTATREELIESHGETYLAIERAWEKAGESNRNRDRENENVHGTDREAGR